MKFGQNLHVTHKNTNKKPQDAAIFTDNGIKGFRFFNFETVCHVAKHIFFARKLVTQKVYSYNSKTFAEPEKGHAAHAVLISRQCPFYEGSF
jgi:hypothetical protein